MSEIKNRHVKNIKRNKNNPKETYTLRSLVEEITGIKESTTQDREDKNNFESAYKELQRIVKTMQGQIGSYKGKINIHHTQKKGFVEMTRALYFQGNGMVESGQARDLYEKLRKKEALSEQELVDLTEVFKKSWEANPDSEEKTALLEEVRIEEAFLKWMDEVHKIVSSDIDLVETIASTSKKIERMQEYLDYLSNGLNSFRQQVKTDRQEEVMIQRLGVNAIEKGYDPYQVLSDQNSKEFKEVFKELVIEDSKYAIEEFAKKLKQQLL